MSIVELTKKVMEYDLREAQKELHEELSSYKFDEDVDEEINQANICFSCDNTDVYVVNYDKEHKQLSVYYLDMDEVYELPLAHLNIFNILDIIRCLI